MGGQCGCWAGIVAFLSLVLLHRPPRRCSDICSCLPLTTPHRTATHLPPQGISAPRYQQQDRTPEQEVLEKRRQVGRGCVGFRQGRVDG
jgi:hypothetical protein